jgi:hypothetical protein
MMYKVTIVNPRSGEESVIHVFAEKAAVDASPCGQTYVQTIARPEIPDGFLPIGNGVRPVVTS